MTTTKTTTGTTAQLVNKGEKSRVEAYEMVTSDALSGSSVTVTGDVRISDGAFSGIENGRAAFSGDSAGDQSQAYITSQVTFYCTADGHVILTGAAEIGQAAEAIQPINNFVSAVKEKFSAQL